MTERRRQREVRAAGRRRAAACGGILPVVLVLLALAVVLLTPAVARAADGAAPTAATTASSAAAPTTSAPAWTPPLSTTPPASFAPTLTKLPAAPAIKAQAALLIEPGSGRILYSRAANTRLPMASTTKIMTGILTIEKLPLDATVTVSKKASETIGSGVVLEEGETLTVEQLLHALLIDSSNDAAIALAEAVSGTVDDFVALMNRKAKALGLNNTRFANPHGMTAARHFSSAADLAKLAAYALRNPVFSSIVDTWTYTLPRKGGTESLTFTNSNLLLQRYPWVIGVKTGSTPAAGDCLVAAGSRDGVTLIAVVLNDPDDASRWHDSAALLKYGLGLYRRVLLTTKDDPVTKVTLAYPAGELELVAADTLALPVFATEQVTTAVEVKGIICGPLDRGAAVGTLTVKAGGKQVATVDLVAGSSVPAPSLAAVLTSLHSLWPPGLLLESAFPN